MNETKEEIGQCYTCQHCSENGLNAIYCSLRLLKSIPLVGGESSANIGIMRQMQAMKDCKEYKLKA